MQTFVIASTSRVFALQVRPRDTVRHVKDWIYRFCYPHDILPSNRQRLMWRGVELDDDSSIFLNQGVLRDHAVMIELDPPVRFV